MWVVLLVPKSVLILAFTTFAVLALQYEESSILIKFVILTTGINMLVVILINPPGIKSGIFWY